MLVIGSVIAGQARADETDTARTQLDRVLAVLRIHSEAASKACLDAMAQVHDTEQQVTAHTNDTGSHPELDIARDVLDSDYQNSLQLCGADAGRVCREKTRAEADKVCAGLRPDVVTP